MRLLYGTELALCWSVRCSWVTSSISCCWISMRGTFSTVAKDSKDFPLKETASFFHFGVLCVLLFKIQSIIRYATLIYYTKMRKGACRMPLCKYFKRAVTITAASFPTLPLPRTPCPGQGTGSMCASWRRFQFYPFYWLCIFFSFTAA